VKHAAGGVLTAKQAPHRPGIVPPLGLRAWERCLSILSRTDSVPEIVPCDSPPRSATTCVLVANSATGQDDTRPIGGGGIENFGTASLTD
jgi:hypothetical protein